MHTNLILPQMCKHTTLPIFMAGFWQITRQFQNSMGICWVHVKYDNLVHDWGLFLLSSPNAFKEVTGYFYHLPGVQKKKQTVTFLVQIKSKCWWILKYIHLLNQVTCVTSCEKSTFLTFPSIVFMRSLLLCVCSHTSHYV